MAITRVQTANAGFVSLTGVATVTLAAPANHNLLVLFAAFNPTGSTVITSVSQTNATWNFLGGVTSSGSGKRIEAWAAYGSVGAGTSVAVTLNNTARGGLAIVSEYNSTLAKYTGLDRFAGANDAGSDTDWNGGLSAAITNTGPDNLCVSGACSPFVGDAIQHHFWNFGGPTPWIGPFGESDSPFISYLRASMAHDFLKVAGNTFQSLGNWNAGGSTSDSPSIALNFISESSAEAAAGTIPGTSTVTGAAGVAMTAAGSIAASSAFAGDTDEVYTPQTGFPIEPRVEDHFDRMKNLRLEQFK